MEKIGRRLLTGSATPLFPCLSKLYRLPELQGKELQDDELTIRRLFRMCVHNEYFARFCCHPKIVSMVTELLGPDVKLLQSMSLLKPPGKGYHDHDEH